MYETEEIEAAGGAALAVALDRQPPASARSDADLLESVAAWERLRAWAAERQAVEVAELLSRRRSGRLVDEGVDEIAARLAVTRAAAGRMAGLAVGIREVPVLAAALSAGQVDERKTHVLLDEAGHLPVAERCAVIGSVLPDAPGLTAPQVRHRVRRALLEHDPREAERRHGRARVRRCVRLDPAPDAMAWLVAYLPASAAAAAFATIDRLAASASASAAVAAASDDGEGAGVRDERGLDERSLDERRADVLVDLLMRGEDGAGVDDVLGRSAGGRGARAGSPGRRTTAQVTVAAGTLLGLDDQPGTLAGYGPVPASVAREIAGDSTWRRLLTDPTTGTLIAQGTTRYRPPDALAAGVRARDATCRFPGCRVPAWRCDLDHVVPYDRGRPDELQTTTENLQALCRHHHRLKTHGGWTVERDPATGDTMWTGPTGHRYVRPAHQSDPSVPVRDAVRQERPESVAAPPHHPRPRAPAGQQATGPRDRRDRCASPAGESRSRAGGRPDPRDDPQGRSDPRDVLEGRPDPCDGSQGRPGPRDVLEGRSGPREGPEPEQRDVA